MDNGRVKTLMLFMKFNYIISKSRFVVQLGRRAVTFHKTKSERYVKLTLSPLFGQLIDEGNCTSILYKIMQQHTLRTILLCQMKSSANDS